MIQKTQRQHIHLAEFAVEDVIPFRVKENWKNKNDPSHFRIYKVGNIEYKVRMTSLRFEVFAKSLVCAACGLVGSKMILDTTKYDNCQHFNLYAVEHGELVLMTKDHIVPVSDGGKDSLDNLTTCCLICNNLKGKNHLTYSEVEMLRLKREIVYAY